MAIAAALGTAAIYPLQPAVSDVADGLDISIAQVGIALACGPVGYLVGLATLVPLVDRFPPKNVLAAQFGALAAALAANATAGSLWTLGLTIGVIGACSTVGAQLSSITARFVPDGGRATALGVVTAGISAGIIAGRIAGGWLTETLGWRGGLLVFAIACAVAAFVALRMLPATAGSATDGYLATLRGLPGLFLRFPVLRIAAIRGALWFFAFCAVWAGLAVALAQPPYSYSAERIGLYALAGLLGIVATRIAGVWTDRVGARRVMVTGLVVAAVAAVVLAGCLSNPVATLVCLAVFDAGLFAAQVANQSTVLALDPAAPARFNSAYMVVYFVGGSLGTAFGAAAVGWLGWPATAAVTAGVIGLAILLSGARSRPAASTFPAMSGSPCTPGRQPDAPAGTAR
ncbi:MFS transporter [Mycolicibacterium neworleansense]|uniref:Sialic acid-transport integral membrane protein NanT n=1 Tax=Mycolicibacterium neworleansense TaxID=146018 RepID=A0A0H5RU29_9MYCO|nr:MFS transporter [Mycolicibacterium neworleansense]MCV7362908.1 MFS transporter [Mycolicibacterium neworleansense]CRZ17655.1 sialic acid-transport integral membrane protein NanT [Mycolicibacterium neworleansense]